MNETPPRREPQAGSSEVAPQELASATAWSGATDARRRFLRGHDLYQWWRDWGRSALQHPQSAGWGGPSATGAVAGPWRPNGFYSHLSKRAMACEWEVFLNYGQYPEGAEAALAALDELENWESQLSVFRTESEISRLNRLAYAQPVPVTETLWDLLTAADHLWQLTGGAFDITAGGLSECWGFLKREGRMPNDRELAAALESVGMDKVEMDPAQRTVRFLHPGVTLNLGGIGKGWTLDRVANQLLERGVAHFAFHGGQSSVVARGCDGRSSAGRAGDGRAGAETSGNVGESSTAEGGLSGAWRIRVTHPIYPDRGLGVVDLRDRALGTSGSARQFIHYRGRRLSHILDPRSGRPAEGVWSATVVAPLAAQADALGTACFVMGEMGCQALVEQCPDLGILLVVPDGTRHRVVVMGQMDGQWLPDAN